MKKSFNIVAAVTVTALALSLAVEPAKAAVINWGSPQAITGNSDVLTTGTLFASANFVGSNTTVNGVTFNAFPITGGGTSATVGNINVLTVAGSGTGFIPATLTPTDINTWATLSTEYKNLLAPTLRRAGGGSLQFTLSNLTVGGSYAIQYWVNDSRWSNPSGISVNVGTAVLTPNTSATNGGVGQWVTGLFTANATTQTFSASPATLTTTYANAMQVRLLVVPEPTQMVSVAAIGAALGMWRMRKLRRNGSGSNTTAC